MNFLKSNFIKLRFAKIKEITNKKFIRSCFGRDDFIKRIVR